MKKAKPFLKWAGGKTQLLDQFENFYPLELYTGKLNKYIEPFVGGGAVFFHIIQKFNFEYAYISDINKDLVLAYRCIQKKPAELINYLEIYQKEHNKRDRLEQKKFFLEIRQKYNQEKENINYKLLSKKEIERIAQLIYINKVCFNGLFRLNSKGDFNVSFGDCKKPKIVDSENIYLVSKCLNNTEIKIASYEKCFKLADPKTFIYFDPPYKPLSKTSNFTTYGGKEFKDNEQIKLSSFFNKLDKIKKSKLMLSNSDPKNENPTDTFFDTTYENFFVNKVFANRIINSNSEKRGKITEVLITNYNPKEFY